MTERCKYSRERLKQIINERGVVNAIDDIDASAIDDGEIRRLWRRVQDTYIVLEEVLKL